LIQPDFFPVCHADGGPERKEFCVAKRLPDNPDLEQYRRQAIVDAALAVLAEKGLDAVSFRTIARAVGVKAPSVCHGAKTDIPFSYTPPICHVCIMANRIAGA